MKAQSRRTFITKIHLPTILLLPPVPTGRLIGVCQKMGQVAFLWPQPLRAADWEQSRSSESLLPVCSQSRVTAVCLLSSKAVRPRSRAWPAASALVRQFLQVERAPQYSPCRATVFRKSQALPALSPVRPVPTSVKRLGCQVSLERRLYFAHSNLLSPTPRVATPKTISRAWACLRTSIFVHR